MKAIIDNVLEFKTIDDLDYKEYYEKISKVIPGAKKSNIGGRFCIEIDSVEIDDLKKIYKATGEQLVIDFAKDTINITLYDDYME